MTSHTVTSVVDATTKLVDVVHGKLDDISRGVVEAKAKLETYINTAGSHFNDKYCGLFTTPTITLTPEDGENIQESVSEAFKTHQFVKVYIHRNCTVYLDSPLQVPAGHALWIDGEHKNICHFESRRSVIHDPNPNDDQIPMEMATATIFLYPGSALKVSNTSISQVLENGSAARIHQGIVCISEYNFGAASSSIEITDCNVRTFNCLIHLQGQTQHEVHITVNRCVISGEHKVGWFDIPPDDDDDDDDPIGTGAVVGIIGIGSPYYQQCRFSFVSSGVVYKTYRGFKSVPVMNVVYGTDETARVSSGNYSKNQFYSIA